MLRADERLSDQATVLITSKSNLCVCVLALMDEGAADLQRGPESATLSVINGDDKTVSQGAPMEMCKTTHQMCCILKQIAGGHFKELI